MDTVKADALRKLVGSVVRFEFDDGEVVNAALLHVDAFDYEYITYDVLDVMKPVEGRSYDKKNAYVALIPSIRRWTVIKADNDR